MASSYVMDSQTRVCAGRKRRMKPGGHFGCTAESAGPRLNLQFRAFAQRISPTLCSSMHRSSLLLSARRLPQLDQSSAAKPASRFRVLGVMYLAGSTNPPKDERRFEARFHVPAAAAHIGRKILGGIVRGNAPVRSSGVRMDA